MNLLIETKEVLEHHGKTLHDIEWIGGENHYIDIEKFIELADVEYDSSYGSPKVAVDLVVIGKDFWLERGGYDGAEWWEYKQKPQKPNEKLELKALTISQAVGFDVRVGWENLEAINGIKIRRTKWKIKNGY